MAGSLIPLSIGLGEFLRVSREEQAYAWSERSLTREDYRADAERRLAGMARRDRDERLLWRWLGVASVTFFFASSIAQMATRDLDERAVSRAATTAATTLGLMIPVFATFTPTRTEQLAAEWFARSR
jgi:hypothetical protein